MSAPQSPQVPGAVAEHIVRGEGMQITSHIVTTPPRDAATVVLLRDGPQGLEVFLMKRAAQSDVLGGAYVFPGGKVDGADAAAAQALLADAAHHALVPRLGEPDLAADVAAAFYVAAVREAFEECGVQLAAADLFPWVRWITPRQASLMNKRFDTRFFLAAMPSGQDAAHDNHETTASAWMTPREALTRYWAREFDMAPPQIMSLVHLGRHATAASVLAEARTRLPPTIEPAPFDHEGMRVICYPGDERHPVPTVAVPGPTRLMFRNRRFEPSSGTLEELLAAFLVG